MLNIEFDKLPREITELKERIEKATSSSLEIRHGEMSIGANETLINLIENGKPTIIVREGIQPSDDDLYHELSELDIRASNGIYKLGIEGSLFMHVRRLVNRPAVVVSKCHSIFYHSFFFKKMQELGYHPTRYIEKQLDHEGTRYPSESYQRTDISLHVTLDLWHLILGFPDEESRAKTLHEEISRKFEREDKIAQAISQISEKFTSPELETDLFPEVLSCLFSYKSPISWRREDNTVVYF